MIGIGVKRTSGSSSTFSLNSISALLQSVGRFVTQADPNLITPLIAMSRTGNGVDNPEMWCAPCAITFSASGTTKTAETNPFRNLFYYWDFGDTAKENDFWENGILTGTQSKNKELGPVAGHVYDTPGNYTVTLTVIDAYGNINTETQAITIADPDVVYAGAKTICYSSTGDFTGAPSGSTQTTETSWSSIWADNFVLNSADKRILLRSGDVFDIDLIVNSAGRLKNIQIGSFGTGSKPELRFTSDTASGHVYRSSSDSSYEYSDNITLYNLSITNPHGLTNKRFASITNTESVNTIESIHGRFCFIDVDCNQVTPFNISAYGCAVVGCSGYNPQINPGVSGGHNNLFVSDTSMSFFYGNYFDNVRSAEHACRIQGFRDIAVSHNTIKNPATTKHCLALRGDGMTDSPAAWVADTVYTHGVVVQPPTPNDCVYRLKTRTTPFKSGLTEPTWTTGLGDEITDGNLVWECLYNTSDSGKFAYISKYASGYDNHLTVDNPGEDTSYAITAMCQVAPNANTAYEPIEDVLLNSLYFGPNLSHGISNKNIFDINAKRLTIRNAVINGGSTGTSQLVFSVHGVNSGGNPATSDLLIENTSVYSLHAACIFIQIFETGYTSINAKNALVYAPNSGESAKMADTDAEVTLTNCSTLTQMKTVSPGYAVEPPTVAADFSLTAGSYAINGGVAVEGGFVDFYGTTRDRTSFDIGAISKDS